MIISIRHRKEILNWNDAWIYFGSNYLDLARFEKKIDGKRISLSDAIHDQAEIQREDYLKWIEDHRKINNDSLSWWMTQLAGRNSAATNSYLFICQLFAIIETAKNINNKNLLIICENVFLQKLLCQNLKNDFSLNINFKRNFFYFFYFLVHIYSSLLTNVSQIIKFIIHRYHALKTKPKNNTINNDDILLFHQCLDDKCFLDNKKIVGRYFGPIPFEYEKKGYNVFQLAWLNNIKKPLPEIYKLLRINKFIVVDDWLKLHDYIWAISKSLFTPFNINFKKNYKNLNVKPLVQLERLNILGSNASRFWRYIPMIKRLTAKNKIKALTYYDHYENIFYEHPIRYIIKKLPIKSNSIGFYHTLHSNNYLGAHHHSDEWESDLKPDKVVCFGELSKTILIKNGTPEKIIFSGAGIRQNLPQIRKKFRSDGDLLIPLSLTFEYSVELIKIIINLSEWLNNNKIKVNIKPHPSMNINALHKALDDKIPDTWYWEKGDINEALKNSLCCIAMATGSVYDAIINGCFVIPIKSELLQMDNYLDIFEKDYPLMKAIKPTQIKNRLEDIYHQNKDLVNQHLEVQDRLYKGINKVNEKTLKDFYPYSKS